MSDRGRFQPGDARIGRALREAVETCGRAPAASPSAAGLGTRAFLAAAERGTGGPRPSGQRPRFGLVALTAVLAAAVAAILALWPVLASHRAPPRPAPAPAASDAGAR